MEDESRRVSIHLVFRFCYAFFSCFRSLIHLLLISSFGITYTFISNSQVLKLSNFTIRPSICFLFSISEVSVLQFLKYHVLKPSRIIYLHFHKKIGLPIGYRNFGVFTITFILIHWKRYNCCVKSDHPGIRTF